MSDDIHSDRKDLMEHLRTHGNRSYRRYSLIRIEGRWVLERDPICWMFDEVMNEMCGTEPDPDDRRRYSLTEWHQLIAERKCALTLGLQ